MRYGEGGISCYVESAAADLIVQKSLAARLTDHPSLRSLPIKEQHSLYNSLCESILKRESRLYFTAFIVINVGPSPLYQTISGVRNRIRDDSLINIDSALERVPAELPCTSRNDRIFTGIKKGYLITSPVGEGSSGTIGN